MDLFKRRNADIRLRGDDISLKTYLNRRYPTIRATDPYNDHVFRINFYLTEPDEENNHIIKHHEMFKSLLEKSELIRTLWINVHTWVKHYLYVPSINFDIFSTYELQMYFIAFLKKHDLIEIHIDSIEPCEWLSLKDVKSPDELLLPKLFIQVLLDLALNLTPRETDYKEMMPKEWLKTALNPDTKLANEFSN
jgi:hypothetical protein